MSIKRGSNYERNALNPRIRLLAAQNQFAVEANAARRKDVLHDIETDFRDSFQRLPLTVDGKPIEKAKACRTSSTYQERTRSKGASRPRRCRQLGSRPVGRPCLGRTGMAFPSIEYVQKGDICRCCVSVRLPALRSGNSTLRSGSEALELGICLAIGPDCLLELEGLFDTRV